MSRYFARLATQLGARRAPASAAPAAAASPLEQQQEVQAPAATAGTSTDPRIGTPAFSPAASAQASPESRPPVSSITAPALAVAPRPAAHPAPISASTSAAMPSTRTHSIVRDDVQTADAVRSILPAAERRKESNEFRRPLDGAPRVAPSAQSAEPLPQLIRQLGLREPMTSTPTPSQPALLSTPYAASAVPATAPVPAAESIARAAPSSVRVVEAPRAPLRNSPVPMSENAAPRIDICIGTIALEVRTPPPAAPTAVRAVAAPAPAAAAPRFSRHRHYLR